MVLISFILRSDLSDLPCHLKKKNKDIRFYCCRDIYFFDLFRYRLIVTFYNTMANWKFYNNCKFGLSQEIYIDWYYVISPDFQTAGNFRYTFDIHFSLVLSKSRYWIIVKRILLSISRLPWDLIVYVGIEYRLFTSDSSK